MVPPGAPFRLGPGEKRLQLPPPVGGPGHGSPKNDTNVKGKQTQHDTLTILGFFFVSSGNPAIYDGTMFGDLRKTKRLICRGHPFTVH